MTSQYNYYLVYKPYGMLCQFTPEGGKPALSSLFKFPLDCYPVGRLETESEGLLLLTNDKRLNAKLIGAKSDYKRTFLVQVDGAITEEAVEILREGLEVKIEGKMHKTLPAVVKIIEEPILPLRNPPVRFRKTVPTSWISITLTENRNKIVRQMTAAVGFPALRIVLEKMEKLDIRTMKSGDVVEMDRNEIYDNLLYDVK